MFLNNFGKTQEFRRTTVQTTTMMQAGRSSPLSLLDPNQYPPIPPALGTATNDLTSETRTNNDGDRHQRGRTMTALTATTTRLADRKKMPQEDDGSSSFCSARWLLVETWVWKCGAGARTVLYRVVLLSRSPWTGALLQFVHGKGTTWEAETSIHNK